ncbi:MAG TPA: MFS transporter [Candidatus Limnocylindrales bacterium]|nr:MFS transporter [Candidatus Limnocylindrales bacterium]
MPDTRRALVLICLFAVAVSTLYTNHGPVLGLIRAEFGLSAADAGALATAFFGGAAVVMLFGGLTADRLGPRRIVTLGFAVAALSNLLLPLFSPSYPALLAWRFIGGMGGGFAFAAGAAYTRGVFEGRGRHFAQGLYGASFLLGSGAPLVFMPLLAGADGDWRRAYLVAGLGVVLAWLAWWRLAPPCLLGSTGTASLAPAFRAPNSWLLALCHMCGFGMAMVLGTWVTTYLADDFALSLGTAGALGSLVLVTGIAGRSLGGAILERGVPPLRLIRIALALAAGGMAVLAVAPSLLVALAAVLTAGIGVGLPYAAVFNGAAASVPESPATAQAVVGWGGTMTAVVAPPIVGALLDLTGDFAAGFAVLAAFVLVVLAATSLLRPFAFAPHGPGASTAGAEA